jgi:hypothetical protein
MVRRLALLVLLSSGLIGTASARVLHLGYEAYAGGLHVMSLEIGVDERSGDYRIATDLRTRGLADFFVGMQVHSESSGAVQRGDLVPGRYRTQGKFGHREAGLVMTPRPGGGFAVEATPPPEKNEPRTPVPAASLTGAIDPLSAILHASRTVAETGSCRQRVAVFDGRRRYDLVFTDEGERALQPTRYSVFSGPARLCRLRQERIGGFLESDSGSDVGRDSTLWIAAPLRGAPPVPVRLELDTRWGWITLHLDEVSSEAGTIRLARDSAAK